MAEKTPKGTAGGPVKASKSSVVERRPAHKAVSHTAAPPKPADGEPPKKLAPAEKRKFRELLMAVRSRLDSQINEHRAESLRREDGVNSEEDGTDAFDRQLTLGLVSAEQDIAFEVEEALRRLEENTYGLCESCGCRVEQMRLEAIPFVRNCVRCQSEREHRTGFRRDVLGVR